MTDFNYRLTYNGNFRWQDFRSSNSHYTLGVQVWLDIVTFDNNSQTLLHIHNYHTNCEAQTNKHVKKTLSCFIGEGRIEHEIFGNFQTGKLSNLAEEPTTDYSGLLVGYSQPSRLAFLASIPFLKMWKPSRYLDIAIWHYVPLVDTKQLPLVLAIPLTNVSAK